MPEQKITRPSARARVLLLPGIGNSGPEHWQSRWEAEHDSYVRVHQKDWDHPVCSDWLDSLQLQAHRAGPDTLIAAHSLGCLLAVYWLARTSVRIGGALLVAVPDPNSKSFPSQAIGFTPLPRRRLPCPSIVLASMDDPYSDLEFSTQCARFWGSRWVNIGRAGHINAASGLGNWSEGHRLLHSLAAGPPA